MMMLIVSPNPVQSTLNVETTNNTTFTQIRIFDNMGNVKKQFSYSSSTKRVSLDVAGLRPGLYRLQAFDGTRWASTSFYKQ
jgi:hypothetical protein